MSIQNVMTANPACCTPLTPLNEIAQLMVQHDCGEIPVVDDRVSRRPVGVVTDRDITTRIVASGRNPLDSVASDCMSTPCITVDCSTSLAQCCAVMERHQIRRVPVVDAQGKLCGIVALADIARSASSNATAEVVQEVSEARC